MPHKRAKLSARLSERAKHGTDLPPTGGIPMAQESVPKSIARVLQAEEVRKTYKEKRMRLDDAPGEGEDGRRSKRRKKDGEVQKPTGIKHGESLVQYNRRVEDEMRIPVAEAMHTSRNTNKKALKREKVARTANIAKNTATNTQPATSQLTSTPATPAPAPAPTRKTEFDKRAPTRRLNDIVQAPPNLTKLPRGASKRTAQGGGAVAFKTNGVISMAQKQKMEEEREKAIQRYRELKERRDGSDDS